MRKRIGALVVLAIAAGMSGAYGQCDTVDAISSASGMFRVTGGQACIDSARITWYMTEQFNSGNIKFEWGTSPTSLNIGSFTYPQTTQYSPLNQAKTLVIKGLSPNTTYSYRVTSSYRSLTMIPASTGTFTTKAATAVQHHLSQSLSLRNLRNCRIAIATFDGRTAFSRNVDPFSIADLSAILSSANLSSGAYLTSVVDQASGAVLFSSKKIVH